jgi:transcriptional regulator with XRE-family HTH domain
MKINKYIKDNRLKKGLTRKDVAQKLNISSQFIYAIESGKSNLPIKKISKLAAILGVDKNVLARAIVLSFAKEVRSELK